MKSLFRLIDIYKKDITYRAKCRTIKKSRNEIVEIMFKLKSQNLPGCRFKNLSISQKDWDANIIDKPKFIIINKSITFTKS